jgi:uncharacterized membrane protein YkvA (DUF1232 family)
MGNIFKRKKQKVDSDFIKDRSKKISKKDIERVVNAADDIQKKVQKNPKFKELYTETKQLLGVVKDYWNKEYTQMPWYALTAITFTLLYILNPLDLSPDYIPFFGLVDDASVLTLAISMVKKDLKKYNDWKASQSNENDNSEAGLNGI